MTVPSATPERPAYRDANVLRWVGAYTCSVAGDVVYYLALTWAVTREAGPGVAGVVLAAGAVPRAVLMLAGGVTADRFGPRRVVIGSDLVRCVVVLAAAATVWLAGFNIAVLLALAIVFGVVDALFMPAVGAMPPRIAAADQLARVQGMRQLAVRASNAAGPMVAAFVLATGGAAAAFAAAGAMFAASLALLIAVRTTEAAAEPGPHDERTGGGPWRDLRAGLHYLRTHRHIRSLVIVIGLGETCFSGPVGVGIVLLADERGWGAASVGWVLSAFSIGGAVSGVVLAAVGRLRHAGLMMAASLLLTAATVVLLGVAPGPGVAVATAAILGVTSAVSMVVGHALLQGMTDPRYLGRVTSVVSLCTLGLSPLLFPLTGFVAAVWGIGTFFAGCGAICVLAAGIAAMGRDRCRHRHTDHGSIQDDHAGHPCAPERS